jgi:hypothetical protein
LRTRGPRGILAAMSNENRDPRATVDLVLRVARSADNRLSGTVQISGAGDTHDFSGTLELMSVFEELVPVTAVDGEHDRISDPAVPTVD